MAEPLIITKTPRADHQLALTIQLGPERTEQALQRAVRLVSRRAKIPGFRPGKAPYATLLRMFGKEAVLGEILDDLGQEVFKEALESEQIDPYGQASLEDVTVDPLAFKLVVPLRPTATLGDYRAIRVEAPVVTAGEIDVDAELVRERTARMGPQTVDRPAALGDMVLMDIRGQVGDTTIMDNRDWELTLREESGWLPGFDQAFVGLAAGDEKSFDVAYPADAASRYRGQTASFQVTVKAVKARVLPEIDDAFARSLGDFADLADYRAKTLARIRRQREAEAEARLNDAAIAALIAQSTLAYPSAAVDDTVQDMLGDMEVRFSEMGYTLEDSLRLQGKTVDAYRAELRPVAERRLQARLALSELTVREGISVTAEEKQAELERMVAAASNAEVGRQIREAFGSEAGLRMIERDLLTSRTVARLRAIVTGGAAAAATPEAAAAAAEAAEEVSQAADNATSEA